MTVPTTIHGRGAGSNPKNRFVRLDVLPDLDSADGDEPGPRTVFFHDTTRTIIATNDSPDVGFEASVNPYRGCEHGCVYCFARPTHEYLGFSAGLDFESKIMVKPDAAKLLRAELTSPKWQPKVLQLSGVTDCYQPIERKLTLTRQCLEVLAEFRNPVSVLTKNHLVTRDIDILATLAARQAAVVLLSITTLDHDLAMKMEPRASSPARRLAAVRAMADAGIPVGVMAAPMIPGLNDQEMPAILAAAAEAGAKFAGYTSLRLPFAVKDLFADWLTRHFPDRKEKVLNRIRDMRGGKLNDPEFGSRMRGGGIWAGQLKSMFALAKRKAGMTGHFPSLSTAAFRRPAPPQLELWSSADDQ
ncbi:MAG TPA: PA0069 family radical SAM protein [Tepidisphaeraceae bacterium]|jgi:DNA repair photolyase|nr:PA0069 family radical SAM protein [Tepidisphaeraceae bacterium]